MKSTTFDNEPVVLWATMKLGGYQRHLSGADAAAQLHSLQMWICHWSTDVLKSERFKTCYHMLFKRIVCDILCLLFQSKHVNYLQHS